MDTYFEFKPVVGIGFRDIEASTGCSGVGVEGRPCPISQLPEALLLDLDMFRSYSWRVFRTVAQNLVESKIMFLLKMLTSKLIFSVRLSKLYLGI